MDANQTAANILGKDSKKSIRRRAVDSSDIRSIGYDERTNQLTVRFHSGPAVYIFLQVPKRVYQRLMLAASKGRCFVNHVKGKFSFRVAK